MIRRFSFVCVHFPFFFREIFFEPNSSSRYLSLFFSISDFFSVKNKRQSFFFIQNNIRKKGIVCYENKKTEMKPNPLHLSSVGFQQNSFRNPAPQQLPAFFSPNTSVPSQNVNSVSRQIVPVPAKPATGVNITVVQVQRPRPLNQNTVQTIMTTVTPPRQQGVRNPAPQDRSRRIAPEDVEGVIWFTLYGASLHASPESMRSVLLGINDLVPDFKGAIRKTIEELDQRGVTIPAFELVHRSKVRVDQALMRPTRQVRKQDFTNFFVEVAAVAVACLFFNNPSPSTNSLSLVQVLQGLKTIFEGGGTLRNCCMAVDAPFTMHQLLLRFQSQNERDKPFVFKNVVRVVGDGKAFKRATSPSREITRQINAVLKHVFGLIN